MYMNKSYTCTSKCYDMFTISFCNTIKITLFQFNCLFHDNVSVFFKNIVI